MLNIPKEKQESKLAKIEAITQCLNKEFKLDLWREKYLSNQGCFYTIFQASLGTDQHVHNTITPELQFTCHQLLFLLEQMCKNYFQQLRIQVKNLSEFAFSCSIIVKCLFIVAHFIPAIFIRVNCGWQLVRTHGQNYVPMTTI